MVCAEERHDSLFFTETLVGYGQFNTTFSAAAGQNLAAVGGLHALTESVYRFSAADVRLIRSFFTWHCINFFLLQNKFLSNEINIHQGTIPVACERRAKVGQIF